MSSITLKSILLFAIISESHLFLTSLELTHMSFKKTFVGATIYISVYYFFTVLRIVTGFVLFNLMYNLIKFSFTIRIIVIILIGIFCYRVKLIFQDKKDYGIIDSIICVIGFLLIWTLV